MLNRVLAGLLLSLTAMLSSASLARADGLGAAETAPAWDNHDTGLYVASTMNVLRTADGRPVGPLLSQQYNVIRYAVWEDLTTTAYVIQFKTPPGRNAGMAVYRLGWQAPRSYSRLTDHLGIAPAVPAIDRHFAAHQRVFIGSFAAPRPI